MASLVRFEDDDLSPDLDYGEILPEILDVCPHRGVYDILEDAGHYVAS